MNNRLREFQDKSENLQQGKPPRFSFCERGGVWLDCLQREKKEEVRLKYD